MKTRYLYTIVFASLVLGIFGCENKQENKSDDSAVAEAAEKVEEKLDRAGERIDELGSDEKTVVDNDAQLALSPDVQRALDQIDADIERMENKLEKVDDKADVRWEKAIREAKAKRAEIKSDMKNVGNKIDNTATRTRVDVEEDIVALRDHLDDVTDEMFDDENSEG